MADLKQSRINPSHLRTFVAIANCGNFGEAALELGISQAAVSYAIATLEEELGVVLLTRSRSGATLTPVGEAILGSAQQVLKTLAELVDLAAAHRSSQGGRVRVGVFRSVGTYLLPPVVAQFCERFPQVTVNVTDYADSEAVKQALKDHQIDLGFTDSQNGEEFETHELLKDEYVALLPPSATRQGQTLSWEELAAYPLISEAPGNIWYTRLNHYLKSCGVSLTVAYQIREDSTRVSMVAQGLGAAIIPRLAAEPIPAGVQVCQLPVPLERSIGVAVLASALYPPAVFMFLEMLLNQHRLTGDR